MPNLWFQGDGGGETSSVSQTSTCVAGETEIFVTRWSHSPHESVGEVLHKGINLDPVSGHASRPVTGEQQWVHSSSAGAD